MGVAKAALEATVRYLAADLGPRNIRVNAVSAGPIKTLASRQESPASPAILTCYRDRAPLRRNVETERGGRRGGVSSQRSARAPSPAKSLMVDAGYHITGM